jgi:hypothetical protein
MERRRKGVFMQIQSTHADVCCAPTQDQLIQSIKVGGIYQHYRGDRYKVLAVSRHSEDLSWYVVYEALYDNQVSKIWHRPLAMFLEEIEVNGVRTPRFKLVE